MQVFGHRGSPGFPRFGENTRTSFQKALDAGAAGFELDTRRCADGTIVVIHDATLDRTTNGSGRVSDFTYDELRALQAGHGDPVPRLCDILDEFGGRCTIHVELKESPLAIDVAGMVASRKIAPHVVVIAFDHDDNDEASSSNWNELKSIASTVPTGVLITSRKLRRIGNDAFLAAAQQNRATAIHTPRDVATGDLIRKARALDLPVRVWTVNDPAEALRFRELGAECICSDVPRSCIEALSR